MTEVSLRYRQRRFEAERERQPVSELADWASTALLVGYCLRRVEERDAGAPVGSVQADINTLHNKAAVITERLGGERSGEVTLLDPADTIAGLDRIIGTELEKRHEHVREQLDDEAWQELEQYIAWWVIHGYCVRAVEAPRQ